MIQTYVVFHAQHARRIVKVGVCRLRVQVFLYFFCLAQGNGFGRLLESLIDWNKFVIVGANPRFKLFNNSETPCLWASCMLRTNSPTVLAMPASMRSQAGLVHAEPAGEASALGALPGGDALGGPFSNLSVEENEKQLMIQALKRTSGNRTEAAKLLGISRRTLHRKMARFKLN